MKKLFQLTLKSTAVFLFGALAFAPAARAGITVQAQANTAWVSGTANSLTTLSFTPGTGGVLVAMVAGEGASPGITSITWNGAPLTKAASAVGGAFAHIYYLAAPAAGSGTLSVTLASAVNRSVVGALYATGVGNVESFAVNSSTGSGDLTAGPITATSGALVVNTAGHSAGAFSSGGIVGGGDTPLYNVTGAGSGGGASYLLDSGIGGSYSAQWFNAVQSESVAIVSFASTDLGLTLASPANNQALSHNNNPVTATATVKAPIPPAAPYTVTFYTNSGAGAYASAGTKASAPYQVSLGMLADGTYSIYATVTDSTLVSATSATNTFTVGDLPPAVAITSPANNDSIAEGASIPIAATASDIEGTVTNVDFYADGSLLGSAATPPYSHTWSDAALGAHTLTAVAWDNTGLANTSAVVNVLVKSVVDISTILTPGPQGTSQGILIDTTVGAGNIGRLVGETMTYWGSGGFSVPLMLNGNTLIVDTGGGNEPFGVHGQISGDGTVNFNTVLNHRITVDATSTYTGSTVVTRGWIQLAAPTNALLGTITVGSTANAAFLQWGASGQITDTSDVTLVNSGSYLNLNGFSDRIHNLTLPTGTSVQTGAGGVLNVKALTVAGVSKPKGAYIAGSGFVTGSGYIDVDDFGPPVIATVPDGPASPAPTNSATGLHPMMLTKLDWADCAGASSYDVYFWLTGDSKPVTPTANVALSEYTLSLPLVSVTNYNWQVVAKNAVGPTNGPVWTFSTTDRSHISNVLTPAEPAIPAAGVWIDSIVGAGNSGVLVGLCQTHWAHQGFTVPLDLNGNTLIVDSGGGNEPFGVHGSISGNGTVIFNSVVAHRITVDATSTYTGTTLVNRGWIQLAAPANALCGTITVGTVSSVAFLAWSASDQVNDSSDVTLVSAGSSLALNDYSDTIKSLALEDVTFVETGGGGVLTVSSLTVGGVSQGAGTYDQSNSSFVTGGGSVVVVSPLELPLSGFSRPGGVPTFDVPNTVSSSQYTLVYKDNLTNPAWTPLTGSGTGTGNGGTLRLSDPTPTGSLSAHRFYRLERNP